MGLRASLYFSAFLFATRLFAGDIFFLGSYTDAGILAHEPLSSQNGYGITTVKLADDGSLLVLHTAPCLNPAVLHLHPTRPILYAISERIDQNGTVEIFHINSDFSLAHISSFEAGGKSTCFMGINNEHTHAVLSNYWDATLELLALNNKGLIEERLMSFQQRHRPAEETRQVMNRYDHWRNRQDGPHAHSAHFINNWVLVPDLGENAVFIYRLRESALEQYNVVHFPHGAGPRHLALHKALKTAYVSNELKSSVTWAKLIEDGDNTLTFLPQETLATTNGAEENYVSELSLSPDQRFLYVSNRGHDSIALFSVDQHTGALTFIKTFSSNGAFPRHFSHSPDGRWILVANQNSNSVNVFARDQETGFLTSTEHVLKTGMPNFIRFMKRADP